jgi:hypothetical protein
MVCASCGRGKGRRQCPALGKEICTVCCGTKRLVDIQCPSDCGYLASSREHPAAVVRRQRERDVARLLPSIRHLTERQYQLFFLFHSSIAQHRPEGFARLVDADVAEAAAAFAATLETAARGVIYDHTPASIPAKLLAAALKALLVQIREQGGTVHDREAATALRAIEQGARSAPAAGEGDRAYLEVMGRLLQNAGSPVPVPAAAPPASGSLFLP